MTKSNNEWVPETLDEVEVWIDNVGYWAKVKVLAVDCGRVVWRNGSDGLSYIGTPLEFVRPIKTEAEKRRDERVKQLYEYITELHLEQMPDGLTFEQLAEEIIAVDYIRPKYMTNATIEEIARQTGAIINTKTDAFAKAIEAYIRGELDL